MIKKRPALIGGLGIAVGIMAYFLLRGGGFNASLPAGKDGFSFSSSGLSDITLRTGTGDQVGVNLQGPGDKLKKIRFFSIEKEGKILVTFDQGQDWGADGAAVTGTITLPEGSNIIVTLKDGTRLTLDGHQGNLKLTADGQVTVDAKGSTLTNPDLTVNGGGEIHLGRVTGDLTVNNTGPAQITIADANLQNSTVNNGGNGVVRVEKGVAGNQTVNNTGNGNVNLAPPDNGGADNGGVPPDAQPPADTGGNQGTAPPATCSLGDAPQRDSCCQTLNAKTPPPQCIGKWIFDTASNQCDYHCFNDQELAIYFGQITQQAQQVTADCTLLPDADRDQCCDDQLKNPLSIGPHQFYPDCVGKWKFAADKQGCHFECASYGEMLKILDEIKSKNNP